MPQRWQKSKPESRTEDGDDIPYATPEGIAPARSMDLLTYLKNYEPGELVKVANGTYCTREHDSLKISNGMWYWFSRSIGGASALDYLIRVKGYSLPVAVETILGRAVSKPPVFYKQKDRTSKQLLLPQRSSTNANVTRYLRSRGIHPAILDYCYRNGLLYEGLPYRNAVFIGYDENRIPKYAALRGTVGNYKGEASGSDKQYPFNIPALGKTDLLILDEWMLISLTETEARDLLEIIHARHKRASTIFCSQFAPAGWYSKFPEATIADAILDRIVHDSYTIEIRGADEHSQKSMREVYGVGSK